MKAVKTIIAIIAIVLVAVSCSPYRYIVFIPAYDNNDSVPSEPLWDGKSATTDWYDENKDAESFFVDSAEDLKGLAELLSEGTDFSGKTITQTDDVDLGGHEWVPIGAGKRGDTPNVFNGSFNGNWHTISNFSIGYTTETMDDGQAIGFFGNVEGTSENPAKIENLNFEDAVIDSRSNTAGVAVGYAEYADISGITVKNSTVTAYQGAGAVVGRLYHSGSIENCRNINTSVITSAFGHEDWIDTEKATYPYNAGGIAGAAQEKTPGVFIDIKGNTVQLTDPSVTIHAEYEPVGGIVGTYHAQNNSTGTFSGNTVEIVSTNQIIADKETTVDQRGWFVGGYASGVKTTIKDNTYIIDGDNTPVESGNPMIED